MRRVEEGEMFYLYTQRDVHELADISPSAFHTVFLSLKHKRVSDLKFIIIIFFYDDDEAPIKPMKISLTIACREEFMMLLLQFFIQSFCR